MENKLLEPEEYFEELSKWISEYIYEYGQTVIIGILNNQDYNKEPKRFFYTIVHKTINSLEAANIFIRNFNSKKNWHIPLFIIFRSIIADLIVSEFVIHKAKTDIEKEDLILQIYYDHINYTIESMNQTARSVFQWSDKETKINIESIKSNKYFNLDGTPKFKPLKVSPRNLINKIFSQTNDRSSLNNLKSAYNLYETFSKLEHIGDLSFMLTHRGYDKGSQQDLRTELYDAILITISCLNKYYLLWDQIYKNNSDLKVFGQSIADLHPSLIKA